jgi:hypothetical protein
MCKNHPDRPVVGRGLCQACYAKWYRETSPENVKVSNDKKYAKIKADPDRNAKRAKRLKMYHVKRKYGVTEEQYDQMLVSQNGRCAICDKPFVDSKQVVDHNHATGKVRQLLCNLCNVGLGSFHDDKTLLEKAITYLKKWE